MVVMALEVTETRSLKDYCLTILDIYMLEYVHHYLIHGKYKLDKGNPHDIDC
jgi:hypothetical protein